jgi:hypothetical protein
MSSTNPFAIDPTDYKYGMVGDHVKDLQESLVYAGYEVAVDGVFGKETQSAVTQFEADHAYHDTLSFTVDIRTLTMLFNRQCIDPTPEPPPEPQRCPEGKGMFIRTLKGTGTPEELKAHIIQDNLKWVCVQRLWQYPNPSDDKYYNKTDFEAYRDAWESTGCKLWVWGWAIPLRSSDFISTMLETVSDWSAVGVIVDAEAPWYDQGGGEADSLMTSIQSVCPVGLTSYGAPWYHKTFPFEEFAKSSDFGVPQIYDSNNSMPEDYPTSAVKAWKDLGYKDIVPASSAYKTPEQMQDLLDRTPIPNGALVWWDWYNANQDKSGGRWDVIQKKEIAGDTRTA